MVQRKGRREIFQGTQISTTACLLQFAELFACVTFCRGFNFFMFVEAYHELFDSTVTLRDTVYLKILQQLLHFR